MNLDILQKFGLTKNEAKLYVVLLEIGPAAAGVIIRKSGFQSSVVYHLIGRLTEKGIVARHGKNSYAATDPRTFYSLLDLQRAEIAETKKQLDQLIPHIVVPTKNPDQITIFTGKEALREVMSLVSDELLVYGSTGNFSRIVPFQKMHFQKSWKKKRMSRRNILFTERRIKDTKYEKTRYMQSSQRPPFTCMILCDSVIINLFDRDPNSSIIIKSKAYADGMRLMFETLWKELA